MTTTHADTIVIAGIGQTTVGKLPDLNPVQIQALACLDALDDCGIAIADVDGFINLDPYVEPNSMFSSTVAEYLGTSPYCASFRGAGRGTGSSRSTAPAGPNPGPIEPVVRRVTLTTPRLVAARGLQS